MSASWIITVKYQQSVRDIVALAVQAWSVPVPTFSAAITYFVSYCRLDLPADSQAQRDYFGAHTYPTIKDKKEWPLLLVWWKISRSAMGNSFITWKKESSSFLSLELQRAIRVDQVEEGQAPLNFRQTMTWFYWMLHLGDMTAQVLQISWVGWPASVIMVLDHREELQDQVETISISLFHISTSQSLSMIWWLVLQQQFSRVGTLSIAL